MSNEQISEGNATQKPSEVSATVDAQTQSQVTAAPESLLFGKSEVNAEAENSSKATAEGESTQSDSTEVKVESVVPDQYDLKLGEGVSISEDYLDKTAAFAREQGLSQEKAQALVQRDTELIKARESYQQEQLKKQTEQWRSDIQNDPELGGEHFEHNTQLARKALRQFGDQEFIDDLNASGLGNHKGLFRMLRRAGLAMSDDNFIKSNSVSEQHKTAAEILYGSSK